MATFRQRDSGRWQAIVRRDGYSNQSQSFRTKAEAETWARDVENKMDRGIFVSRKEAETTTLFESLKRYLAEVTPTKKGATQEEYRIKAWQADPLAKRALATLRSTDFATWRDERLKGGYKPATIRNELAIISNLFNVASKEWGINVDNPVGNIKLPRENNSRERRLLPGEEERLLASIEDPPRARRTRNHWIRPIVELALETGMRQGELLSLEWKHVDLRHYTAHLPSTKNGESRTVPLSPRAVAVLEALPRSLRGPVFQTTTSALKQGWERAVARARDIYERDQLRAHLMADGLTERETPKEIRKVMATPGPKPKKPTKPRPATLKFVEQLKSDPMLLNLHFHDLRHEATSRLAEVLAMHELMKVTGHKDTRMLARYYHPRAEDLARKIWRAAPAPSPAA